MFNVIYLIIVDNDIINYKSKHCFYLLIMFNQAVCYAWIGYSLCSAAN